MNRKVERIEKAIKAAGDDDVREAATRQPVRTFAARIVALSRKHPPDTAHYGKRGGRPPKPVYVEYKDKKLAAPSARQAARELGVTYSWMQRMMAAGKNSWYLPECRFRYRGAEVSWERLVQEAGGEGGAIAFINDGRAEVVG